MISGDAFAHFSVGNRDYLVPHFDLDSVPLAGHDAALLVYDVTAGGARFRLDSFVVRDVHGDELTGGQAVEVAGRTLHVVDADGIPAVTFVDTQVHVDRPAERAVSDWSTSPDPADEDPLHVERVRSQQG